ncbi:MAG TPA: helix-turn-helix transcriptional regulator [Steroidobacteraceae bacterium]|nr:helix-turn-helix transcriptional regulator [Steroidobacteraceae bacterium]
MSRKSAADAKRSRFRRPRLARRARVHMNVVGRVERGIYNPTVIVLGAIADALGVPLVEAPKAPEGIGPSRISATR